MQCVALTSAVEHKLRKLPMQPSVDTVNALLEGGPPKALAPVPYTSALILVTNGAQCCCGRAARPNPAPRMQ